MSTLWADRAVSVAFDHVAGRNWCCLGASTILSVVHCPMSSTMVVLPRACQSHHSTSKAWRPQTCTPIMTRSRVVAGIYSMLTASYAEPMQTKIGICVARFEPARIEIGINRWYLSSTPWLNDCHGKQIIISCNLRSQINCVSYHTFFFSSCVR